MINNLTTLKTDIKNIWADGHSPIGLNLQPERFLLTHHREILVPLFKVFFYGTHLSFVMNHILKKKVVKTKQAKSLNKSLKKKILFVIHFVHKAMFLHT